MNKYSIKQMDSYNPSNLDYQPSQLQYELPKSIIGVYSSGGGSEGSGVISAPTISMLP